MLNDKKQSLAWNVDMVHHQLIWDNFNPQNLNQSVHKTLPLLTVVLYFIGAGSSVKNTVWWLLCEHLNWKHTRCKAVSLAAMQPIVCLKCCLRTYFDECLQKKPPSLNYLTFSGYEAECLFFHMINILKS